MIWLRLNSDIWTKKITIYPPLFPQRNISFVFGHFQFHLVPQLALFAPPKYREDTAWGRFMFSHHTKKLSHTCLSPNASTNPLRSASCIWHTLSKDSPVASAIFLNKPWQEIKRGEGSDYWKYPDILTIFSSNTFSCSFTFLFSDLVDPTMTGRIALETLQTQWV